MGAPPDEGEPVGRGTVIGGRYRLDAPLATGGMARVWTAHDEVLGRPVAVKILLDHLVADAALVHRFRAEALAAARLAHPSVVSVYDTCSQAGVEAIVMELVDGETLRRRLDREGRLAPREAARIGARVADALTVAHRAGIVHRDIKPANVLLSPSGRVVVTDFGIAKASETGDLTRDQMLGTAKYLSPEQVESAPVDGRSDIYSLGVVLYEMLCGRVPFQGDSELTTALARLHRDPPNPAALRPEIPAELTTVLQRTLERDPARRWPDAASLARTLTAISRGCPVPADSVSAAAPTEPVLAGPAPARPATAAGASATADPEVHSQPVPPSPPSGTAPDGPPSAPPPAPAPLWKAPRAPTPTSARRSKAPLVVAAVAVVALAAASVLAWRALGSDGGGAIDVTATAFDPFGGDGENDDRVGLVTDGNADTAWSTERYDERDVAAYKGGVGLLLDTGGSVSIDSLDVASPTLGWDAQVYVLDREPGGDRDGWGEVVASATDLQGDARFDLGHRDGRYVLLWITRTGPDGVVEIAEGRVKGTL